MVPIETLASMLDEPSSGSMASASGAPASSSTGIASSSEAYQRDRRVARRVEEDLVGIDVEVLLQIAVGIGAAARLRTAAPNAPELMARRTLSAAPARARTTSTVALRNPPPARS